ncbi:MAG: ATP-binding protein [Proteobacteria bacterium]|nr:ATP-binding protein [Pseudomonadota bacterium]MDA0927706.1 ATP-binding protein [Pseudomonadota bacterium]
MDYLVARISSLHSYLLVGLFVFSLLTISSATAQEQEFRDHHVLVVHDSAYLGGWRHAFDNALLEFLNTRTGVDISYRLSVDYAGINNYPIDDIPQAIVDRIADRHQLDPIDNVVAVLPISAQFIERYGDELLPGVNRIYVVPQQAITDLTQSDDVVVITTDRNSNEAMRGTLQLASQLVPGLTDFYVFSGVDGYAPVQRLQVEQLAGDALPGITMHYVTGAPIDRLAEHVTTDPDSSAGILLSYEADTAGNRFASTDALAEITITFGIPILASYDSALGFGIVGGYMDFAENRGRETGEQIVANAIGVAPLPFQNNLNYVFDGRQLDALGIDRRVLPQDSEILYESVTLWNAYRYQIIAAIVIVLLQAVLILALLVALKRRREVENALQVYSDDLANQKNLFESLINNLPDAVLITHADRSIYEVNNSAVDMFGFDRDELLAMKVTDLMHFRSDEQREAEQRMLDSVDTEIRPQILSFVKSSKGEFIGETIGTRIVSSDGKVLGYFSLIRDVTRRLNEERVKHQSQKMEALGNLVGGIAHDFNNVLAVISAYAELTALSDISEPNREHLQKIVNATRRGSDLCSQILSFSRDMSVEQKPLDLQSVARESLKLLKASIPQKIDLVVNDDKEQLVVLANFTQLQQIIVNLATNASHAVDKEEGKISVEVQSRDVKEPHYLSHGVVNPGSYVVLKVKDNGCGIAKQDYNLIFEPFYTTREGEGTGMGLSMVFKIVRAHGGKINVVSEPGVGTEFEIFFNTFIATEDIHESDDSTELVQGSGERILLVDDEEDLLGSLKDLLDKLGYEVEAFNDPLDALASFRQKPEAFDLVISDQLMPGLSGTGLMQSMRAVRSNLPVIICTGHSELLYQSEASGSASETGEINSIMRKPFTASEMSRNVREALRAGVSH